MAFSAASFRPRAFTTGNVMSTWTGTPGTATIETGEMELVEGGRAYLDAVKPHVESSGTPPTIGVRVGYRDSLGSAVTYTTTAAAYSRTGFANFRVDAKYQRIEVNITGTFEKALGCEFQAKPSGSA